MMLRRMASARAAGAWRAAQRVPNARVLSVRSPVVGMALASRSSEWVWRTDAISARTLSTSTASAATTTATTTAVDTATRDSLVEKLRPLCSALYPENRTASPSITDLLTQWHTRIQPLLTSESLTAHPELIAEIQRAYQQGVAIAFKQREFALAEGLVDQMKQFQVPLHDELYAFRIRATPLQWLGRSKPYSLEELRALDLGRNWEHAVLELVRTEDQPHFRKSAVEREAFQDHVRDRVAAILAEYETDVPAKKQSIEPYNAAVRALALNGLPFAAMLRVLNQIPKDSNARRSLNTETFVALLEGARWQDIPLTIDRLAKSNVRSSAAKQNKNVSRMAAQIWDFSMRAICNSFTERFLTGKRNFIEKRQLRDLQTIFIDVEAQLEKLFPEERFSSLEDHTAVYEIRIKAAALLGMPRQVHTLLDDYKKLTPTGVEGELSKSVFLKALEIFPSVGLKKIAASDIERVRTHRDVTNCPQVVEIKHAFQNVAETLIPTKKRELEHLIQQKTSGDQNDEKIRTTTRELRKAQESLAKLKKKLHDETALRAREVALQHRLRAADKSIAIILEHLTAKTSDGQSISPLENADVAVAVMVQYMTTANRFGSRMNETTRELMATEILRRVDALLDLVSANADLETEEPQIRQLFSLAIKTAASFWREDDVERLILRKKELLGAKRALDMEDYDRLVFLRAASLDLGSAYDLLQEMHYAGTAPSSTTIHRIVTGVLLKLYGTHTTGNKKYVAPESESSHSESVADHAMDDEDSSGQQSSWSSGPTRLEDVASFIQEWYNLYRVKPMAKTVVPVFARLLAANNVWEVKRLLQILESMDGGLSPATAFWLEKRLNAIGKRIEDLRYSSRG